MQEGKSAFITKSRAQALERLGFVWNVRAASKQYPSEDGGSQTDEHSPPEPEKKKRQASDYDYATAYNRRPVKIIKLGKCSSIPDEQIDTNTYGEVVDVIYVL